MTKLNFNKVNQLPNDPTQDDDGVYFVKETQSNIAHQAIISNGDVIPVGVKDGAKIHFGICTTAAATAAKVVTLDDPTYIPQNGDIIVIKYTLGQTATTPTINVNGTGDKNPKVGGTDVSGSSTGGTYRLSANASVTHIFDGTDYNVMGSQNNYNTTYTSSTLSTVANTAESYNAVVNRAVIDDFNGTSTINLPNTNAIGSYFFFYKNAPGTAKITTLNSARWIVTLDGQAQINNTGYIEIGQGSWVYLRTKVANSQIFVESTSPNAIIDATTPGNWNVDNSGDFIPYTNANKNVDLNEKNLTNVGTFRSKRIQNPDNLVVKADKNKTNYLMELTDGTPLIVHQTEVTNPFNLISTPTDNFGFGIGALEENIGEKTIGIGISALAENKGHYSIGIGENSLLENLGSSVTGIGRNALSKNTSHSVIGIGENILEYNGGGVSIGIGDGSLQYNYGRDIIGIGRGMMRYNTGITSTNIGGYSMSYNTGDVVIGIGNDSLRYNDSSNLISIGNNSLNDPQPDTPKEKTFDYDDIDIPNKRIHIPSHGFGEAGFINLIFTQGTGPIPTGFDNLQDGQAYQFRLSNDGDYIYWSTVIDGTLYERSTVNITGQGTGTGHKFTPIVKRNNSISIGNSVSWSDITKDNQTVIKGVEILALDSTIASIDAASDNVLVTKEWIDSQGFGTQTLTSSTSNIISGSTVQRAALTGDVTASQNSNVTTIANNAVTTAKIANSQVTHAKYQNIASQRILGRGATGTGNVQELTLGSNLSISGSTLNVTIPPTPDFIPLTGTEAGKPLIGEIEADVVNSPSGLVGFYSEKGGVNRKISMTDDGFNYIQNYDDQYYNHFEQSLLSNNLLSQDFKTRESSQIQNTSQSTTIRTEDINGNIAEIVVGDYGTVRFNSDIPDEGFSGYMYYNHEQGLQIRDNNSNNFTSLWLGGISGQYNNNYWQIYKDYADSTSSNLVLPDSGGFSRRIPVSVNGVYANQQGDIEITNLTPQIEVSGSQTVQAGWNGKEVTFMSNGLLTIPNTLVDEFSFALAADSGVTITWAIASPFTWRVAGLPVGDAPPTMTEGQFCQVSRRKGTNEIRVRGL